MSRPDQIPGFLRSQKGSATALSLYLLVIGLMVGSFAVDMSNLTAEQTRLQTTADSSAHDALQTREFQSETTAVNAAVTRSEINMPPSVYGHPLDASNVDFGTWDTSKRTFTADSSSKTAVQVTMFRDNTLANAVTTFLFGLVGIDSFNIAKQSTYAVYYPGCLTAGFVARGVVNLQSNNNYFNGFCIHSQQYVVVNSNNSWDTGSIVSMPDISNLQLPNSGFTTNTGLQAALRNQSYNIRILDQLPGIIAGLTDPKSEYFQPYITNTTPITTTKHNLTTSDLVGGNIYIWDCQNNSQIQALTNVRNVVIVANCDMVIGQGVTFENAILANTAPDNNSIYAPYGFQLGALDNCAPGGGAQVLTLGGFHDAAGMTISGSQIITAKDLDFQALANGIQGASLIAGGQINGTSNMNMANCPPAGMNEFRAEYFRLVD